MLEAIGLSLATVSEETVPPGRFVDLPGRGRTWVVDLAGPPDAPVVVLVHGLVASTYLNWFPAFGPLSEHFRVVATDLRGHGRGIPLGHRRFRLADCADDIAAVSEQLGIERFIAVGYSMGGPVCQLLWHRHRDRVAGLVLAATSRNFMGTPQERMFFQSMVGVAAAARTTASLGLPFGRGPAVVGAPVVEGSDGRMSSFALGELRRTSPGTVIQALSAIGRFSSHEWVADIDVPTAVVVTAKDRAIGPHRQLKLANAIPGSTIHPAKAGHTGCVLGARAFVPALVEACLSVAGRTAGPDRRTSHDRELGA